MSPGCNLLYIMVLSAKVLRIWIWFSSLYCLDWNDQTLSKICEDWRVACCLRRSRPARSRMETNFWSELEMSKDGYTAHARQGWKLQSFIPKVQRGIFSFRPTGQTSKKTKLLGHQLEFTDQDKPQTISCSKWLQSLILLKVLGSQENDLGHLASNTYVYRMKRIETICLVPEIVLWEAST